MAYLNANKQPQNGRDWVLGYVDLGRQEAKHDTPVPEPEERIAEEKEPARSESDFPEKDLDQFCLLPDTPIRILCQLSQESAETVRRALGEDYLEALQAGMLQSSSERGERRISFPCRYRKANGEPVNIVLQMGSKYGSKEWYLKYVDCKVQPGKAIEEFAYLGWPNFLARLTEKALPESWDFENSEFKDYDILKKYITYTFYRLKLEGKICVSDDGEFAAFNTGLVDEHYNDICACFEPNHAPNTNVPWVFKEFATPGYREYGKRLNRYFNPLPRPAEYFERKEDLLYDLDQDLWCDYDHIIIDNIHRLPVNFLCSQLHDCEPAQEYLKALKGGGGDKTAAYQKLRELLEEGSTWCNRLTYRLREAIHLARKKIRWNYKTAIPSYFPTGNSMSLMLPLCLENEQKVDTVLVVELMPSGNYQGQTILTLQQAYIDARLVCRPNSEWLTTENLSNINSDVEDEDEV